jgi:hypothetical protein
MSRSFRAPVVVHREIPVVLGPGPHRLATALDSAYAAGPEPVAALDADAAGEHHRDRRSPPSLVPVGARLLLAGRGRRTWAMCWTCTLRTRPHACSWGFVTSCKPCPTPASPSAGDPRWLGGGGRARTGLRSRGPRGPDLRLRGSRGGTAPAAVRARPLDVDHVEDVEPAPPDAPVPHACLAQRVCEVVGHSRVQLVVSIRCSLPEPGVQARSTVLPPDQARTVKPTTTGPATCGLGTSSTTSRPSSLAVTGVPSGSRADATSRAPAVTGRRT